MSVKVFFALSRQFPNSYFLVTMRPVGAFLQEKKSSRTFAATKRTNSNNLNEKELWQRMFY